MHWTQEEAGTIFEAVESTIAYMPGTCLNPKHKGHMHLAALDKHNEPFTIKKSHHIFGQIKQAVYYCWFKTSARIYYSPFLVDSWREPVNANMQPLTGTLWLSHGQKHKGVGEDLSIVYAEQLMSIPKISWWSCQTILPNIHKHLRLLDAYQKPIEDIEEYCKHKEKEIIEGEGHG